MHLEHFPNSKKGVPKACRIDATVVILSRSPKKIWMLFQVFVFLKMIFFRSEPSGIVHVLSKSRQNVLCEKKVNKKFELMFTNTTLVDHEFDVCTTTQMVVVN
jgi:hypothetical protein